MFGLPLSQARQRWVVCERLGVKRGQVPEVLCMEPGPPPSMRTAAQGGGRPTVTSLGEVGSFLDVAQMMLAAT